MLHLQGLKLIVALLCWRNLFGSEKLFAQQPLRLAKLHSVMLERCPRLGRPKCERQHSQHAHGDTNDQQTVFQQRHLLVRLSLSGSIRMTAVIRRIVKVVGTHTAACSLIIDLAPDFLESNGLRPDILNLHLSITAAICLFSLDISCPKARTSRRSTRP